MRIQFIYPGDLNVENGGTTHTLELIHNWLKEGHKISLITSKPFTISNPNFKCRPVPSIRGGILGQLVFSLISQITLLIWSKRNGIDVIFERKLIISFTSIVARILRKPIVIEINDFPSLVLIRRNISRNNRILKSVLGVVVDFINWLDVLFSYDLSTRIILTAKIDLQATSSKVTRIDFGANTEIFKPMNMRECRSLLGLDAEDRIILFVGSFLEWQGIDIMINAMPKILDEIPNARIMIVGDIDSEEKPYVDVKNSILKLIEKNRIQNQVILTGRKPYSQIPVFINSSDICVVPLKLERKGFTPLKLLEYMACGKSVIASDIPGLSNIVADSKCGLLFRSEDSDDFAKACIELLENAEAMKSFGMNGMNYIGSYFTWERVSSEVLQVIEEARTDFERSR